MEKLKKNMSFKGRPGPLVFVVMDGVGLNPKPEGNAVQKAYKPTLDVLMSKSLFMSLQAHGCAVGLPSNSDMGNSEVGHNAIGAGRVFEQGAKLVNLAIETRQLWKGETWKKLVSYCKPKGTLHFIGLFSDGNVHSHMNHLKAMIKEACTEGVTRLRVHILLDGRDVGQTSALDYVIPFEAFLKEMNVSGCDCAIASGGGRMRVTMDRYEADWNIVKWGWETHVLAKGEMFASAEDAIRAFRKKEPGITDQFLPAFVIQKNGKPAGPIEDGDSVIFFNFRGDRAIEISRAFEGENFDKFDRIRVPKVQYAGMMEYDGDLHIPKQYLVAPPAIRGTMGERLSATGVTQYACSETQKYGHVTYFWNGNWSGKFNEKLETYVEIPSDRVPFEQRPWMKAAEITDAVIGAIREGKHRFIRLNYPNGDMVGHTGVFRAAVVAVETVDLCLARLKKAVEEARGILLVTADHGNSDEMFELDKAGNPKLDEAGNPKPKTSHTLNPVPLVIYDPLFNGEYRPASVEKPGLSNLASTCIGLLGLMPPREYDPGLLEFTG